MNDDFDLIADIREDQGKGASRRLRHEGKVPAIIYGAGRPPRALVFDHNRVVQQLDNEKFYSSVLNIQVGEKSQAAILKDVQRHPSKPLVMHLDFQRIVEDQEIRMNVPLHFVNEETAPGVKAGGQVSHTMTDIEIICAAKDLPEFIEIDMGAMELGDVVHMSELKMPAGVELVALTHGDIAEHDTAVVSIHTARGTADESEEGEEGETTGEG